jgi:hypothetical protein
LGEYGFYLGPNNALSRNFPEGVASYQYTSTDIAYFSAEFGRLAEAAGAFAKRLGHR